MQHRLRKTGRVFNSEWHWSARSRTDFAAYELNQWSPTAVEHRFKRWRIRRADFANWYAGWSYAPLVSIDQLWPSAANISPDATRAAQAVKSVLVRGRAPGTSWAAADEPHFEQMKKLIDGGQVLSTHGAASTVVNRGHVAGKGERPSKIKRLCGGYKKWIAAAHHSA